MVGLDSTITENIRKIMAGYMLKCQRDCKADFLYEFETVIRYNGIPVSKVMVKGGDVQAFPIGGESK